MDAAVFFYSGKADLVLPVLLRIVFIFKLATSGMQFTMIPHKVTVETARCGSCQIQEELKSLLLLEGICVSVILETAVYNIKILLQS